MAAWEGHLATTRI